MPYQDVLFESKDGIARVILNRPEKRNAIRAQMLDELDAIFSRIERDPEIKVVVLTGAGSSFSTGRDFAEQHEPSAYALAGDWFGERREVLNQRDRWTRWFWELPQPIIAQVRGYCMVFGFEFAMNCDLVIAAEDARFIWRPIGGTGKVSSMMPWLLGLRQAKELLWTKRWISGKEAEKLGLINKAVPDDQLEAEVEGLARQIMETPPELVYLDKMALNKCYELAGLRLGIEYGMDLHAMAHTLPVIASQSGSIKKEGKRSAHDFFHKEPGK